MYVTARSYLTAGIAALGVGALALSPVQPIPNPITAAPERVVSDMAVGLAAAVDPIQALVNLFETSAANIEILGKFNEQNPFPLLQTIGANIATYFEELTNGNAGLIPEQIWNNLQTFFQAPWDPGNAVTLPVLWDPPKEVLVATGEYLSNTQPPTPASSDPDTDAESPFGTNLLFLQLIAGSTSQEPDTPEKLALAEFLINDLAPLLQILNTPATGQIVSWLGPLISPVVALTNSFTAIGQYFQEGKILDAFYEFVNIPTNMTNAFLNGAGLLDLTPVLGQFFNIPAGIQLGFNLGGLLNAMPQDGSLKVNPEDPQPDRPTVWAGGTGLDSLSVSCGSDGSGQLCDFLTGQPPAGLTNGLFGAGIGLGQFLAEKLLITPPTAAAEPAAVAEAAPETTASAPAEAPAEDAAPAVAEAPAEEAAPAVADAPAPVEVSAPAVDEVAEEIAPAVVDEVAEEVAPAVVDIPEVEAAPAGVADDPAPKPAAGEASDDAGDTGSRATDSRRGASDAD